MLRIFLPAFFLLVLAACQSSPKTYDPPHLRKLDAEEVLDRARQKRTLSPYVVFKDSVGSPLSEEYKAKLDKGQLAYDYYVDAKGELVELIVRESTYEDDLLDVQHRTLIAGLRSWEQVEPEKGVDCRVQKRILQMVYKREKELQKVRDSTDLERFMRGFSRVRFSGPNPYQAIDSMFTENKRLIFGILEKCGTPTRREVGEQGMMGLFYTIQHMAQPRLRVLYYPVIKECVDKGDLKPHCLALMEDRMMRDFGKKQLFGSQLMKKDTSEVWTLYPVREPEKLNQRRAAIGLKPIEQYLESLEVEYTLEGLGIEEGK
ncbi:MAG: hypothetical protein HRU41_38350 [Saprospiraceae bacterium]|nr:hypothetical protein [Saprospiraceae bacterium]